MKNMKKFIVNKLFTIKRRSVFEYELIDETNIQLAINKLGQIEDFERTVKKPVLEYLSEMHEKYQELRRRNAALSAFSIGSELRCPICNTKVLPMMNYCSQCGQAIIAGKEINDGLQQGKIH